jgi:hypothetical protein
MASDGQLFVPTRHGGHARNQSHREPPPPITMLDPVANGKPSEIKVHENNDDHDGDEDEYVTDWDHVIYSLNTDIGSTESAAGRTVEELYQEAYDTVNPRGGGGSSWTMINAKYTVAEVLAALPPLIGISQPTILRRLLFDRWHDHPYENKV